MTGGGRPCVAFYAPMKAPGHPVPSGDRTVARLYIAALEKAGFEVVIASDLRIYDGKGDVSVQAGLRIAASKEAARLKRALADGVRPPSLWFTYHVYHKSPDLLGPDISASLGIPYVISEPSYAPKRRTGAWAGFLAASESAISQADRLFVSTAKDEQCISPLARTDALVRLSPFIDTAGWPEPPRAEEAWINRKRPCRLITVAMMRHGDKFSSFVHLSSYLKKLENMEWTLNVVGDGPVRGEVEEIFAPFGNRVNFVGMIGERAGLAASLAAADLFIWPAVNEAFGMAMLEAALMGLPVMAGDEGGVSEVVLHGKTGFLAKNDGSGDFCQKTALLIANPLLRNEMGAAARRFVLQDRSLDNAAVALHNSLLPLIKKKKR